MNQLAPAARASFIARVRNILLSPRAEWARIDLERASVGSIYTPYVLVLAAIGPLAALIGGQLFGHGFLGVSIKPTLAGGLATAVVGYGLALAGVFILALIIEALAPSFGGTKDRVQALKIAAYSSTAAWVAGVFQILPALAILGILGLYSLYLLYLGLPILMKAPQEKALAYTIVTIIAAIVIWIVIGALTTAVTGPLVRAVSGPTTTSSATLTLPGGDKINTGELEAAARRMEEAANRAASGQATAVAAGDLAQLLPASIGGLARTSQESGQAGLEGMSTSSAQAVYEGGEARITLKVTDLGGMAALGGLASVLGVQSSRETDAGYERVGKVDGRMTMESWDRASRSGEYSVMVSDRVQVEAEGQNVEMAALKAAVNSIDLGRIERLVR